MAVYIKEMRKGVKGFSIWTAAIAFMLLVCVFMYPDMKDEMTGMNDLFSNMGAFTQAFGMDNLNFGTLIGFYGVECGNMLGIGGGFFAAYIGITMLSKEEKEHTAEFLLTHPISRTSVIAQKALAVLSQIILLNVIVYLLSVASIAAIGESIPWSELSLIHTAYLILQIEIAFVCFGISAFVRRGSIGIGLGATAVLYFMNLIRNISDNAESLKYITPYAYADPSSIISSGNLDAPLVIIGAVITVIMTTLAFVKYKRKDILA